jgi:hypothetical protein
MGPNTKLHDGIIGILLIACSLLAYLVNPVFIILLGVVGVVMLQSALTGFCPVYYTLGKLRKNGI